jgi:hypothetical protein
MSTNSKWKTGLLKTGLPLEYVTSNIFNTLGHKIFGEYPYIRPNESKELKEFSVDLRTYKCLDLEDNLIILSTLVECKYRQPGTSWIFSPYPSDYVPIGILNSTEDLVPIRINKDSIYKFEESLGYCISGVELSSDGGGNTNGAKHGVFQLRFAMPEFLKKDYESSLDYSPSNGQNIDLSCGILVTTADIRVIKPELDLDSFTSADDLNDITDLKEAIILNERAGPQLQDFADSKADELIKNNPELENRLLEIDKFLVGKEWENRSSPDLDTVKRSIGYSAERILIVNHKYLEKTIKNLEKAILEDIKTKKVYGKAIETKEGYKISNLE